MKYLAHHMLGINGRMAALKVAIQYIRENWEYGIVMDGLNFLFRGAHVQSAFTSCVLSATVKWVI